MTDPADARAFRDALSCFPTGVAVITTRWGDALQGLTCNSFSSVSLEPPLVLWSIRTASRSLPAFRSAGRFVINVLSEDQNGLSSRFASSTVADKFETVAWHEGLEGLPVLDGCVAVFECRTHAEHEAGDHVIFIGYVERFEHVRRDDPLVFYRGAYMMVARSLRDMTLRGEIVRADLDEARSLIFRAMLPLACAKGNDADFAALESVLLEMEQLVRPEHLARRSELAVQFLQQLALAAHNRALTVVIESLSALLYHAASARTPDRVMTHLVPLRWRILHALRARDVAEAERAMDRYMMEMLALPVANASEKETP